MQTTTGKLYGLDFPYYLQHVPTGMAYTGQAGDGWLSSTVWDRFGYTLEGANRRKDVFAKMGHEFIVVHSL